MPLKWIVSGPSICLLNVCGASGLEVCGESCNDNTAFFKVALFAAVLFTDFRSARSPLSWPSASLSWLAWA